MKRLPTLFVLLIALCSSTLLNAQIGRIEATSITYEDQAVDALMVRMQPERKDIQKAFDDWMDDRYNINMKGGGLFSDKNLRSAEAVNIPAISADNISLFAITEEDNGATTMTLFASRGLGNFVTDNDARAFSGLEDVFDSFLSFYLPEYYQERVAEARERLEDLRDDLKDAREKIAKNEKDIKELQAENEALRAEANTLEQDIDGAERTLTKRQETRQMVKRQVGNQQ